MKKHSILCALLACLMLAGCGANAGTTAEEDATAQTEGSAAAETTAADESVSKEVFAMDTYMTVTAYGENAETAVDEAVAEIERLDALLSIGSDSSEISQLNASGSAVLSEDAQELVSRALELYDSTGGAFDITVLPLMEAWGFTTEEYTVPSDSELEQLLTLVGSDMLSYDADTGTLTLSDGQEIDLGGIAKGYTSGRIMEIFEENGVTTGMVSLGGNVHVLGTKTDGSNWRVGIQDPEDSSEIAGVLSVADCAVITSGGYERYFEQDGVTYHHILDPETGKPADSGLLSVTIVSEDGTLADGLSTSLFVMGKEEAITYWRQHADEFDAVLIEEDGTISVTEGIADAFSSDAAFETIARSE